MPKARINTFWQDEIKMLAENTADSAEAIQAALNELAAKAQEHGMSDPPPSQRTVSRYIREFRGQPDRERVPYRLFVWPAGMGSHTGIPWEASRACLDLLDHIANEELNRPSIRLVEKFWRATLAAPDADVPTRLAIAFRWETGFTAGLEEYLAKAGWREDPPAAMPEITFPVDSITNKTLQAMRSAAYVSPVTARLIEESNRTGRPFGEVQAKYLGLKPQKSKRGRKDSKTNEKGGV